MKQEEKKFQYYIIADSQEFENNRQLADVYMIIDRNGKDSLVSISDFTDEELDKYIYSQDCSREFYNHVIRTMVENFRIIGNSLNLVQSLRLQDVVPSGKSIDEMSVDEYEKWKYKFNYGTD